MEPPTAPPTSAALAASRPPPNGGQSAALAASILSTESRGAVSCAGASLAWRKFKTQELALKDIDPAEHILFTNDKGSGGAQKTFSRIPRAEWGKLGLLLATDQNVSEWILSSTPVRPYWDLEIEGPDMTIGESARRLEVFLPHICGSFNERFGAGITRADFMILNSSRPGKMSYHIMITEGFYFAGTRDHLCYMRHFAAEFEGAPAAVRAALVWQKGGRDLTVFDMSVYAEHQKLRCRGQSKRGKGFVLALEQPRALASIDTLAGLYAGVGDRRRLNVEALEAAPKRAAAGKAKLKAKGPARAADAEDALEDSDPQWRGAEEAPRAGRYAATGFVAEGHSLHSRSDESYAQLLTRGDAEQYLRLIPNNPPQLWEIYRTVALMASLLGVPETVFEAWARLSPTFGAAEGVVAGYAAQRFKEGYETAPMGYLRKLAKLADPDFFRTAERMHKAYYSPDFAAAGFQTVVERCGFVSQRGTEWENDIMSPQKFIILSADLGAGKSTAIKRLLRLDAAGRARPDAEEGEAWDPKLAGGYLYPRALVITPRITYCQHVVREFEVASYLEGNFEAPRFACSLESLHKTATTAEFDIVIMDEVEAVLSIFNSETLAGRQIETYAQLTRLMRTAKKVIVAGAFLTEKTLSLVKSFNAPTLLIRHEKPPVPGAPAKLAFEIDYDDVCACIIRDIKAGGKPYVHSASKTKADQLMLMLKGAAPCDPVLRRAFDGVQYYSSDANDAVFQGLLDINAVWDKASFVLATPSITVGNSYAPKEKLPPHASLSTFTSIYVIGYPSCLVADIFQGHKRVREAWGHFYFAIPYPKILRNVAASRGPFLQSLGAFDKMTSERRELITAAAETQRLHELAHGRDPSEYVAIIRALGPDYLTTPHGLRTLMFQNNMEKDLSARFFRPMFLAFVARCGYTRVKYTAAEKEALSEDIHELRVELQTSIASPENRFADIEDISAEKAEAIKGRIDRRDATHNEKLQLRKFFYRAGGIDPDLDDRENDHYFAMFCSSGEAKQLRNMQAEAQRSGDYTFKAAFANKTTNAENVSFGPARLLRIRTLCRMLGIDNTLVHTIIPRATIEAMVPYLHANRDAITGEFHLREWAKVRAPTLKAGVELMSKVMNSWIGAKFGAVAGAKDSVGATEYAIISPEIGGGLRPPYPIVMNANDDYAPPPLPVAEPLLALVVAEPIATCVAVAEPIAAASTDFVRAIVAEVLENILGRLQAPLEWAPPPETFDAKRAMRCIDTRILAQ